MSDVNNFNEQIVSEYRANGGQVGGPLEGTHLLLLHTLGAKSGAPRVNPVVYQAVNGNYAVFASKGGAPTNPAWYYNLLAHPETTIEVGDETIDVTARVAEGEESERIWEKQKAAVPGFADYESKTTRKIPVIILERR